MRLRNPLFRSGLGSFLMCFLGVSLLAPPVLAKPTATPSPGFLPAEFAGWTMSGRAQESSSPQVADAANSGVLGEYDFEQFMSAGYVNGDNQLSVRALRFRDATGAYGAFTFYRRPGSLNEQIGRGGAWDGSHALFWVGSILVDATFGHLTAMSAAELRELAQELPLPAGNMNTAPSLPGYLPKEGLAPGAVYSLGSQGYARRGGVLPPALVDFDRSSAEAVTADYSTPDGQGQLTLLEYPTPQLAEARLRDIDAFLNAGNTAAWPQPLAQSHSESILARRSGPLVALINGSWSAAAAHKLLGRINYQADVTWNKPEGYVSEGSKVAMLLLNIFAFIGIVGGAAILLGIFLGGGRALVRRLRGKPASALDEETEFIRLNLNR